MKTFTPTGTLTPVGPGLLSQDRLRQFACTLLRDALAFTPEVTPDMLKVVQECLSVAGDDGFTEADLGRIRRSLIFAGCSILPR